MNGEPPGHRGHPTTGEQMRAARVRGRLLSLLNKLVDQGFNEAEALSFIAGACTERARARNIERWTRSDKEYSAYRSLSVIIHGGASKHWVLDIVEMTLPSLEDLVNSGDA